MSAVIPESYTDLLKAPVVVGFATVNPDNTPQVTPVWCDYDGKHILINTARGRRKTENIEHNPAVAVLAIDPQNPYRYLEVRGKVVEITEEGAIDHIDQLAQQYVGKQPYYGAVAPAEQRDRVTRVILKIQPERVTHQG